MMLRSLGNVLLDANFRLATVFVLAGLAVVAPVWAAEPSGDDARPVKGLAIGPGYATPVLDLVSKPPREEMAPHTEDLVRQSSYWQPRVRDARRFALSREGSVTFAVDAGRKRFGFRRGLTAPMASSVKVMLMLAYLRQEDRRHHGLDEEERTTLEAMITRSDNDAADVVSAIDGENAVTGLARNAGMKEFGYNATWGISRTSARDQASFMRHIQTFIPKRHRRFALGLLGHISSEQSWGIGELPLKGWKLRFKGGWGISDGRYGGVVNHQVAQLSRGKVRIGVAILTQGNPYTEYGSQTLKGVARRLLRGLPN